MLFQNCVYLFFVHRMNPISEHLMLKKKLENVLHRQKVRDLEQYKGKKIMTSILGELSC